MSKRKPSVDAKELALKDARSLNPRPGKVRSKIFRKSSFFDPRDLVQVKYEMLRQVENEGISISEVASDFGFSRPSFYQAKADFDAEGIPGLAGDKRGPRGGHKISDEVMAFIDHQLASSHVPVSVLAQRIKDQFNVTVHPRSIERARARRKKPKALASE